MQPSPVGSLCANLPKYVRSPPIETVLFAWGINEDGQLGLDSGFSAVMAPKVVEAMLGIRFSGRQFTQSPIVAGSRNTLVIDADGSVWSWGWNDRGTLGHGHRNSEAKPRRIQALKGVKIRQVAVNGWHCLAVSENGSMYSWGGNEYLQCGVDPDKRDILSPVPCVPQLKVLQVACGGMHSLALTETGEVWTWGEPWGDFSINVQRQPRPVNGASGMSAIACGAFHNMALSKTGQVFTWGTNDYGQLGNGNTSYQIEPKQVMYQMKDVLISDIAAGGWHSLALSVTGDVWTWGRGEYGRLGIGDRTGSSKLRPKRVFGLDGHRIIQVCGGGTHTMALSDEGRAFIWGRGSYGRLGAGSGLGEKDQYSPMECILPGGCGRWRVISIACGGRHSAALALPIRQEEGGSPRHGVDSDMEDEKWRPRALPCIDVSSRGMSTPQSAITAEMDSSSPGTFATAGPSPEDMHHPQGITSTYSNIGMTPSGTPPDADMQHCDNSFVFSTVGQVPAPSTNNPDAVIEQLQTVASIGENLATVGRVHAEGEVWIRPTSEDSYPVEEETPMEMASLKGLIGGIPALIGGIDSIQSLVAAHEGSGGGQPSSGKESHPKPIMRHGMHNQSHGSEAEIFDYKLLREMDIKPISLTNRLSSDAMDEEIGGLNQEPDSESDEGGEDSEAEAARARARGSSDRYERDEMGALGDSERDDEGYMRDTLTGDSDVIPDLQGDSDDEAQFILQGNSMGMPRPMSPVSAKWGLGALPQGGDATRPLSPRSPRTNRHMSALPSVGSPLSSSHSMMGQL